MDECTVLSPLGMLGYGIPEASIRQAIDEHDVDVIASDAGSIDPGPNYLGLGKSFTDRSLVEHDLGILVDAHEKTQAPLLIGSAGGSGAKPHLEWATEILRDVIQDRGVGADLSVARIYTDVGQEYITTKRDEGEIHELDFEVELTDSRIEASDPVVAQIGHEPFVKALEMGADVVLGGRSSDLSPFTAVPRREGFDPGLSAHMAKILECGAHATVSGTGSDSLLGVLGPDHFEVVPPNAEKRCTVESVAAHTLYEKSDPYRIHLPDGTVDVSEAEFEQVTDRRVRVRGSDFHPSDGENDVLVEGVRKRGYRTVTPAGLRDPTTIDHLDELIEGTKERVREFSDARPDRYELSFRTYGVDGVPLQATAGVNDPPEVGIVIDALGETQTLADEICSLARSTLLHHPFEGRTATGGNLAFPYSPSDISVGEVYEFSIYHVLEEVDPFEIADVQRVEL